MLYLDIKDRNCISVFEKQMIPSNGILIKPIPAWHQAAYFSLKTRGNKRREKIAIAPGALCAPSNDINIKDFGQFSNDFHYNLLCIFTMVYHALLKEYSLSL